MKYLTLAVLVALIVLACADSPNFREAGSPGPVIGPQGEAGNAGNTGLTGETGPKGPRGYAGESGEGCNVFCKDSKHAIINCVTSSVLIRVTRCED